MTKNEMLEMKRKRDYDRAKIKEQWKEQFGFEILFNDGINSDGVYRVWIFSKVDNEDVISFSSHENFSGSELCASILEFLIFSIDD